MPTRMQALMARAGNLSFDQPHPLLKGVWQLVQM